VNTIARLVIAGTASGVGKTSIALGLMSALRQQGYRVQPFKVGPDFIDPTHHQRVTGRSSHNLDGWMLSQAENLAIFDRYTHDADLAIIEGVMGLHDGYGATTEAGSTAQMAKWLNAPVLLVLDAGKLSRSAAAIALGYQQLDPAVSWAGVVCNRVGSASHLARLTAAIETLAHLPVLGGLPKLGLGEIPSRHLGLWLADEAELGGEYITAWREAIAQHLDLERLCERLCQHVGIAQLSRGGERSAERLVAQPINRSQNSSVNLPIQASAKAPVTVSARASRPHHLPPLRIGIAYDHAFNFYYAENLRRLQAAGAELVEFSPIVDPLPPNLDGLYIGGGYPERFAQELAQNQTIKAEIYQLAQKNRPIYAECGGLMYLSQGLITSEPENTLHPWVGIFPFAVRLGKRPKLGYLDVQVTAPGWLKAGTTMRGHRFHYSELVAWGEDDRDRPHNREKDQEKEQKNQQKMEGTIIGSAAIAPPVRQVYQQIYQLSGWQGSIGTEGYQIRNTLASYVHLHFGSNPDWVQQFLACADQIRLMHHGQSNQISSIKDD